MEGDRMIAVTMRAALFKQVDDAAKKIGPAKNGVFLRAGAKLALKAMREDEESFLESVRN